MKPGAIEAAYELMRLLFPLGLFPVEHHVHELIKINRIDISLPRQRFLRVPILLAVASAEPALRVAALNGEAGLSPDVEVVSQLDSERMGF